MNLTSGLRICAGLGILVLVGVSCAKSNEGSGQSYSFTSAAKVALKGSAYSALAREPSPGFGDSSPSRKTAADNMCQDSICFTPSSVTGKLYGTGFLIQSGGQGMVAYFGQTEWSSIKGTVVAPFSTGPARAAKT